MWPGITILQGLTMGLSCQSPPPILPTPASHTAPADPCVQGYEGTSTSIRDLMSAAGLPAPVLPPRDEYLARCRALGLDDAATRCLDPAVAIAEPPRCTAALAKAQQATDALGEWFASVIVAALPKPQPAPATDTPATGASP